MANNNRNRSNDGNQVPATAIAAAMSAATSPADVQTIIADAVADDTIGAMIDAQADHLESLQADRAANGYGDVECAAADGPVSERFGRKSCPVIETLVTIPGLGIKLPVTIWGRLATTAEGTSITFEASVPRGVKCIGDGKDRMLAHVETAAMAWAGYTRATDSAADRLMGNKPRSVAGQLARPTLVKRVIGTVARTA